MSAVETPIATALQFALLTLEAIANGNQRSGHFAHMTKREMAHDARRALDALETQEAA